MNKIFVLEALKLKYEAEMKVALLNMKVYYDNSVGIGDHSDVMEAFEIQLRRYNDAKELYNTVKELVQE
jgi:hypothetical protein